jgi:hypothetical protein
LNGNSIALGAGGLVVASASFPLNIVALDITVSAICPVVLSSSGLDLRRSIGGAGGLSITGAKAMRAAKPFRCAADAVGR